jgi:hypothetical protein
MAHARQYVGRRCASLNRLPADNVRWGAKEDEDATIARCAVSLGAVSHFAACGASGNQRR